MVGAVGTRETRSNHTRVTAWLHEMTERCGGRRAELRPSPEARLGPGAGRCTGGRWTALFDLTNIEIFYSVSKRAERARLRIERVFRFMVARRDLSLITFTASSGAACRLERLGIPNGVTTARETYGYSRLYGCKAVPASLPLYPRDLASASLPRSLVCALQWSPWCLVVGGEPCWSAPGPRHSGPTVGFSTVLPGRL